MFNEFDNELTVCCKLGDNFFYDWGVIKLQQLKHTLTKQDYCMLLGMLPSKSLKYQEYLAYVITDRDIQISELELVIKEKINGY